MVKKFFSGLKRWFFPGKFSGIAGNFAWLQEVLKSSRGNLQARKRAILSNIDKNEAIQKYQCGKIFWQFVENTLAIARAVENKGLRQLCVVLGYIKIYNKFKLLCG